MTRFLLSRADAPRRKWVPQGHALVPTGLHPSAGATKKKKNALRRIAAVNGEPKNQTLQRQRQLPSQESDEVTPT